MDTEIPSDWKWHKAVGDSAEWCAERRSPRWSDVVVGAGAPVFHRRQARGSSELSQSRVESGRPRASRICVCRGSTVRVGVEGGQCVPGLAPSCAGSEILGCQRGMWAART